ncbi:hypothetical protein ES703_42611 [subsurface metagenome]
MTELRIWLDVVVCGPRYLVFLWTGLPILFAYLLGRCR